MLRAETATVYKSDLAGRRFFTLDAACKAEARAIIKKKYPSEEPDMEVGMQGWYWHELPRSEVLYRRLVRLIKTKFREAPNER